MAKIFLYAYDKVNLGDDLFVRTIAKRYQTVTFYYWSSHANRNVFRDVPNIKVIDAESSFVKWLRKIRPSFAAQYKAHFESKSDAVVYVGGSIFIEYDSWEDYLNWWEYAAEHYPLYVIGANFGPFKAKEYKERFERIFKKVKDVCFRDTYSKNLFPGISTIRYAPDLLFSAMEDLKKYEKKQQVFVSLINCERKARDDQRLFGKDKESLLEVVRLCKSFLEDGYEIILSSFCKAEGDEETVKHVYSELDENKVSIVNYDGLNIRDVQRAIAESEFVIAERFHAAILGFAGGCNVVPVFYSDKTKNILNDLDFKGQLADIRVMKQGDINYSLLRSQPHIQKVMNLDQIIEESKQHFMKLDVILNG